MKSSALNGMKVVEYTSTVAGAYCGKLLGDLGADVIKVEPPAGDPARRIGPFPQNQPAKEDFPWKASGSWIAVGSGQGL